MGGEKAPTSKGLKVTLRFVVFFQGIPKNPCKFKGVSPDVICPKQQKGRRNDVSLFADDLNILDKL